MNQTFKTVAAFAAMLCFTSTLFAQDEMLSDEELKLIQKVETARVAAIQKVYGAVVAVYGEDRNGGGSGVIFDPAGYALTNHHVIAGPGIGGWAGLADGKLYRWDLVGTDPGGDVAIIKLKGKDKFPCAKIGDSDTVRVGDWAMAMGNPFILAEDQTPTVTLGIVSGVKRYQAGAGKNMLVYGNCIQIDSSINPGNSGGPLFNMNSEVIGINGRGSFKERGRVNVGLGYAISTEQIKNFIPDLMATKLVEHGTFDATFGERDGKVVCTSINLDSDAAKKGLSIGNELVAFEGKKIKTSDQFTNDLSMYPEEWPAEVTFKDDEQTVKTIVVRLYGLPYGKGRPRPQPKLPKNPTPQQKKQLERMRKIAALNNKPAGTIRNAELNKANLNHVLSLWKSETLREKELPAGIRLIDNLSQNGEIVGSQNIVIATDGRFRIEKELAGRKSIYTFNGSDFISSVNGETKVLSNLHARLTPEIVQVTAYSNIFFENPYAMFGKVVLDGSDKAQNDEAYRIQAKDSKGDWFYAWFSLFDENEQTQIRLLKASADKDADGESGGVNFSHWKSTAGILIPEQRDFIRNLEEQVYLTAKATNVSIVNELNTEWFEISPRWRRQRTEVTSP